MDGSDFLTALALLLILEGLMPFLNPEKWKDMLRNILTVAPSSIRGLAFISMMCGLLILYFLN